MGRTGERFSAIQTGDSVRIEVRSAGRIMNNTLRWSPGCPIDPWEELPYPVMATGRGIGSNQRDFPEGETMAVSFIVPAFNAERSLAGTIATIRAAAP